MSGDTPEFRDRLRKHVEEWRASGSSAPCAEYVKRAYAQECGFPAFVMTAILSTLIQYVVGKLLEEQFGESE